MFSGPHRIYVSYSSTDRCATRFKTFSDYNDFVINRKKKKTEFVLSHTQCPSSRIENSEETLKLYHGLGIVISFDL